MTSMASLFESGERSLREAHGPFRGVSRESGTDSSHSHLRAQPEWHGGNAKPDSGRGRQRRVVFARIDAAYRAKPTRADADIWPNEYWKKLKLKLRFGD